MKKKFVCGHSGKGQYCHRCEQAKHPRPKTAQDKQAQELTQATAKAQRESRSAARAADVICLAALDHLPALQGKARNIIERIVSGENYTEFHGKRLAITGNEIVSVPVGMFYRLTFSGRPLAPLELLSHEAYSGKYES